MQCASFDFKVRFKGYYLYFILFIYCDFKSVDSWELPGQILQMFWQDLILPPSS